MSITIKREADYYDNSIGVWLPGDSGISITSDVSGDDINSNSVYYYDSKVMTFEELKLCMGVKLLESGIYPTVNGELVNAEEYEVYECYGSYYDDNQLWELLHTYHINPYEFEDDYDYEYEGDYDD